MSMESGSSEPYDLKKKKKSTLVVKLNPLKKPMKKAGT